MLTAIEKKILVKVAEMQLISRQDLKKFLNGTGSEAVDTVAKNLVKRSLLTEINPIGSTCYVITQRGMKMLEDLKI